MCILVLINVISFIQLKMRTGGVEQARMSRRKKSPKPKPKKTKQTSTPQQPSQTSAADTPPATGQGSGPQNGQVSQHELQGSSQSGLQTEKDAEQALRDEVESFAETDQEVNVIKYT